MTEAPELSIGGGGSVTMMSNRSSVSSRWFRPSAMMTRPSGSARTVVGIGVVEAEHVGDGRDQLDDIGLQAGDERRPERRPHPERDDQGALRIRAGR